MVPDLSETLRIGPSRVASPFVSITESRWRALRSSTSFWKYCVPPPMTPASSKTPYGKAVVLPDAPVAVGVAVSVLVAVTVLVAVAVPVALGIDVAVAVAVGVAEAGRAVGVAEAGPWVAVGGSAGGSVGVDVGTRVALPLGSWLRAFAGVAVACGLDVVFPVWVGVRVFVGTGVALCPFPPFWLPRELVLVEAGPTWALATRTAAVDEAVAVTVLETVSVGVLELARAVCFAWPFAWPLGPPFANALVESVSSVIAAISEASAT